jgi:hypothetical protein
MTDIIKQAEGLAKADVSKVEATVKSEVAKVEVKLKTLVLANLPGLIAGSILGFLLEHLVKL